MPRAVLARQAERLREQHLQSGQTGQGRVALGLVPGDQDAAYAAPEQQEGCLATRLVAAEEGDLAEVFAVGVGDQPVPAGTGEFDTSDRG